VVKCTAAIFFLTVDSGYCCAFLRGRERQWEFWKQKKVYIESEKGREKSADKLKDTSVSDKSMTFTITLITVSIVCFVCHTYHHFISFWLFCMRFSVLDEFLRGSEVLDDFFFGFAVSHTPQCSRFKAVIVKHHRNWSYFYSVFPFNFTILRSYSVNLVDQPRHCLKRSCKWTQL